MTYIGFLSPHAEFFPCSSWGHMEKAARLCDERDIFYVGILDAEKQLLDRGWVIFNARGAYCGYYHDLSEKVLNYLKDNIGNYNNNDQEKDVQDMLERFTVFGHLRAEILKETNQ